MKVHIDYEIILNSNKNRTKTKTGNAYFRKCSYLSVAEDTTDHSLFCPWASTS